MFGGYVVTLFPLISDNKGALHDTPGKPTTFSSNSRLDYKSSIRSIKSIFPVFIAHSLIEPSRLRTMSRFVSKVHSSNRSCSKLKTTWTAGSEMSGGIPPRCDGVTLLYFQTQDRRYKLMYKCCSEFQHCNTLFGIRLSNSKRHQPYANPRRNVRNVLYRVVCVSITPDCPHYSLTVLLECEHLCQAQAWGIPTLLPPPPPLAHSYCAI